MSSGITVLCVDDDPDIRSVTAATLERREGVEVEIADRARDGLDRFRDGGIDCIVSDYDMPGMNGLEFLEAVRDGDTALTVDDSASAPGATVDPEVPFILFTGTGSEAVASEAISAGVTDYVRKGGGSGQYASLAARIETAVEQSRERRQRHERLRDLERYRTYLEDAPIKLFAIDADARFVWLNDAYAEGFAESKAELIGTEFPTLVERGYYREEAVTRYLDDVRTLLSSSNDRETAKYEIEFQSAAGETRIYDVHITLLPLEDGEFAGTLHALRDVTQRERYRTELERQNERLEQFASLVSHDLRNPLNVAQGNLELHLEECPVSAPDELSRVRCSLDRMDELVEDLLSLARHGRTSGDPEPIALDHLVRDAWDAVDTTDATLECSVSGTITADEGRVQALFENLFRNSVEHGSTSSQPRADDSVEHGSTSSHRGSRADDTITVTVGRLAADRTDGDESSGIYVADDGRGFEIDPATAFEFGRTTAEDGTGFGLAIVREIAEAHGWTVTAEESEAGGARFSIRGMTLSRNDESTE